MANNARKALNTTATELESASFSESSSEFVSSSSSTTSLQVPALISALVQTPQELEKLSGVVALAPGLKFRHD